MSWDNNLADDDYRQHALSCVVCFEPYNRGVHAPVVLVDCGHTICKQCAERLLLEARVRGRATGKSVVISAGRPAGYFSCS